MQLERPTDRPVKDCRLAATGNPGIEGFSFQVSLLFIAKAISIICNVFTLCFVNHQSAPQFKVRSGVQS